MDADRLSAIKARVSAATPGPWEVTEIRDGRQPEGVEELGVFAPNDPRSYQKPDETWHGALVCRGMDGPTRAANAAFIARAREDVEDLVAEVERLTALHAERDAAERTHASAYAGAVSRREEAREACAVLCDAISTERDDAARKRRTHGSLATRDEDCTRLAGQAQGAALCAEKIREGGE